MYCPLNNQDSDSLWESLLKIEASSPKKEKKTQLTEQSSQKNAQAHDVEDDMVDFKNQEIWFGFDEHLQNFLGEVKDEKSVSNQFLGQNKDKAETQSKKKIGLDSPQFNDVDCFLDGYRDMSSHLMRKVNLKKKWKKNTNVPKFIVRVFMKYFNELNENKNFKYKNAFKKAKEQIEQRTTNNYNITDILNLLDYPMYEDEAVFRNSKRVMRKVLNSTMKEQIINNQSINTNKLSYMIAVKIYSIRCRSNHLIDRVKVF